MSHTGATMSSWAATELQTTDMGDVGRNRRLVHLVEDLAARPESSVPQASRDAASTQAAYDFWQSPHVLPQDILAGHRDSTVERVKQQLIVLAIQDTTEFNFTDHPKTQGLGYLDNANSRGLKMHSVLCVSTQQVPLGVLHQEVWVRDLAQLGKKHQRHKRPLQDKESQRWLTALLATEQAIDESVRVVTVADQEADIYELFALPRRTNSELLIRAYHNRSVKSFAEAAVEKLQQAIRQSPVCGQLNLELQRQPQRQPRLAILTLGFATVELQPPQQHPQLASLQPIIVPVILAQEENPPTGVEPINWLLLTTLAIASVADVVQYLRWYSYRWLIKRYHYVLKSGCRVEQLQLESAARLQRALATYAIVTWRLLWITYQARAFPDQPADSVLAPHEWQALYCHIHKTPLPAKSPPTLHTCVRWLAQLGGFLGRKRDGEPGVKTLWRGLRRLYDIAATWQLSHPSLPVVNSPSVKKDAINA
jgi:hypothetical protein